MAEFKKQNNKRKNKPCASTKNKKRHLPAPFSGRKNKPGLFLTATVFILKFTHTSFGIEHFLFAGIERVALGTDFDIEIMAQRGTGFKSITTGAGDLHGAVFGVCCLLHCPVTPPYAVCLPGCWKRARIIANSVKNSRVDFFSAGFNFFWLNSQQLAIGNIEPQRRKGRQMFCVVVPGGLCVFTVQTGFRLIPCSLPPRYLLTFHRVEEFGIIFCCLHFIDHKYHSLNIFHRM